MKYLIAILLSLLVSPLAEAAIAFVNSTTMVKGTAANATGTEPASCADGNIEIACLNIQNETPPAVTGPAGWSNVFNGTTMVATDSTVGQKQKTYLWWIRRSGVPALTWTFLSSFRGLNILCYSGTIAAGEPWSFGTTAVRDDSTAATFPAVSGTTTDANEMLVWCGGDWQGGTAGAPPTGFTERIDANGNSSVMEVAEKAQAAAGATGSITGASYTGTNGVVGVLMGGLRPLAAAGGGVCPSMGQVGCGM